MFYILVETQAYGTITMCELSEWQLNSENTGGQDITPLQR
jgi:hypothetical protein